MSDYKYTNEDLKAMQAWPLARKIRVTQTRIMEFYERFDEKVSVSISGGKDSSVLLDLARRCYPDMEAVYVNTGLDFPEVRSFAMATPNVTVLKPKMRFDEVVKEYGWCYPSKDVAVVIYYARKGSVGSVNRLAGINPDGTLSKWNESHYKKWAFLLDAPFKISDMCCDIMKERPLNEYHRKSGKYPIIGTMAIESDRRRRAWIQSGCNNFNSKHPISRPLSFWTNQNILEYIRMTGLPMASVYGEIVEDKKGRLSTTGEQRTGCMFCPIACHREKVNRFQRMAVSHPKLHKYCMETLGLGEFLDYLGVPKV
jgi:3'-phosphoadenosine 5'-phosphosulfate sulfotransferase (PAPS reductase)/FAD synthetase